MAARLYRIGMALSGAQDGPLASSSSRPSTSSSLLRADSAAVCFSRTVLLYLTDLLSHILPAERRLDDLLLLRAPDLQRQRHWTETRRMHELSWPGVYLEKDIHPPQPITTHLHRDIL